MNPASLYHLQQGIARTIVGGRLEKESDTELRWVAQANYSIGLYNGESWEIVTPSGLVQAFSDSTTISGAALTYDTNYDVYAKYISQDNFSLEFQEWATASGRYEEPQRFEGIKVRDLTVSGMRMRYLGIVRLDNDSGAKFKDERQIRFLFNEYNKVLKPFSADADESDGWDVEPTAADVWESWALNGDSYKMEYVGDANTTISLLATLEATMDPQSSRLSINFGIDNKNPLEYNIANSYINQNQTGRYVDGLTMKYCGLPGEGYHYIYPLICIHVDTDLQGARYWEDNSPPNYTYQRSSVQGEIWC